MNSSYIYHIISLAEWNEMSVKNLVTNPSLESEGFIHCCNYNQINGVLERYFKNVSDLVLLKIDCSVLLAKLIYEMAPIGEAFPHVYGPINISAIIEYKQIQ